MVDSLLVRGREASSLRILAFGYLVLMILFCRLRPGCFAGGDGVPCFLPVSVLLICFGTDRFHAKWVEEELRIWGHVEILRRRKCSCRSVCRHILGENMENKQQACLSPAREVHVSNQLVSYV